KILIDYGHGGFFKIINMKVQYLDLKQAPETFFNILPKDWQNEIVPYWKNYANTATVNILTIKGEILGGGIVFSKVAPDTMIYKEEAENMFKKGFLYLGFLWIKPRYRNKGLASLWLKDIFNKNPDQKYWLSIEDYLLANFYLKNGFKIFKELTIEGNTEWIMTYTPIP